MILTVDFDEDGYLNASDMETALKYITNGELEQEELDYITSKIIGIICHFYRLTIILGLRCQRETKYNTRWKGRSNCTVLDIKCLK